MAKKLLDEAAPQVGRRLGASRSKPERETARGSRLDLQDFGPVIQYKAMKKLATSRSTKGRR